MSHSDMAAERQQSNTTNTFKLRTRAAVLAGLQLRLL